MGFKEVALGAIGYVIELKRPLATALLVPFVIYMVLQAIMRSSEGLTAFVILSLLTIPVQTIFAVTTHRIILLGPHHVPKWGVLKWTGRETFFALHIIGLGLITAPFCLLGFIPEVGWFIALIIIFWISGRLSLVFPAIAVDKGVTFRLSWKLTKNYQLLMFLVVLVFPLLFLVPVTVLDQVPYTFLVAAFTEAFATIFIVAALSVVYKVISKEVYGV